MSDRRVVNADPEKCTGCKICEFVCSGYKEGEFNPLLSRIRTVKVGPILNTALACRLCDDPVCVRACPSKALSQNEDSGLINVDTDKCTGCGWCVEACEFGSITLPRDRGYVIICDLCDGDPKCVQMCPKDALSFENAEVTAQKMRRKVVVNLVSSTD